MITDILGFVRVLGDAGVDYVIVGGVATNIHGALRTTPYLHNGSIPTLRALLLDQRPAKFYRAYDVYDWRAVGVVATGPDAAKQGALLDTSVRGNGNGGHTYGSSSQFRSAKRYSNT